MPLIFPRRLRFRLNTIFLLSLGIAIGYAWNLWVWRVEHYFGSEANMVTLPTYIIEPPDVLSIEVLQNGVTSKLSGEHLVAMDGQVNLGEHGTVFVAGMTVAEAENAIKKQLSKKLTNPRVVVDVAKYNSKAYYIICEDAPFGDDVTRALVTGDETVLDAIALLEDAKVTEATEIRIARPSPNGVGPQLNIPVNFHEITRDAATARNYQLLPGDRVFISQKRRADRSAAAVKESPKR